MIKVFMGLPSMGERLDVQTYALREMEARYRGRIEFVYPKECVHRMFHDFARNAMTKEFLASDCNILWFLDADVVPPVDILDVVTDHSAHWELAGAPYPVWMTPEEGQGKQIVLCVYLRNETGMHAAAVPGSGTAFVDGLATGCLFIKREVFSSLSEPYFEFKYDEKSRNIAEGEDLGFCRKVSDQGYKFFVDFSKVCSHHKKVNLIEVNNYAVQFAKKAVDNYDAQIRPAVTKLAAEVERLKGRTSSGIILPK